jgi:hypothetical protein
MISGLEVRWAAVWVGREEEKKTVKTVKTVKMAAREQEERRV